ncbi:MAG: hypothetical protein HY260_12575 [Chloroflexi bacterium]|nr:hypothetical protein [Chloroflexota bacterium]
MAKKVPKALRRKATNNHKPKQPSRKVIERYDTELRKHYGRFVCVVGYKIVSVADGPGEALEIAHKKGYKNARVKRAPLTPDAPDLLFV